MELKGFSRSRFVRYLFRPKSLGAEQKVTGTNRRDRRKPFGLDSFAVQI
jgi:hypothetical protein